MPDIIDIIVPHLRLDRTHCPSYGCEMLSIGPGGRAIRDAAPVIRNFGWLFAAALGFIETVVAFFAKRLDSDPLRAVQVALMFFTMAGISMALVAWSIAVERALLRLLLAAVSILPLALVIHLLLQLGP